MLLNGEFGDRCPLDDDYMSDFGIKTHEIHKKWSVEEIKQAIDRFDFMCSSEYIADKTYYPKNFPEFIYNPRTEKSFIMTLLGEWKEVPGMAIKPLDQEILDMYRFSLFPMQITDDMYRKLTKNVNYIIKQQRVFQERVGQYTFYHELKDKGFYRRHIKYIEMNYQDNDNFGVEHIGPMTYGGFGIWLKNMFDIDLSPTETQIESIKRKYASDSVILKNRGQSTPETTEPLCVAKNGLSGQIRDMC